jgi:hypothetical protein
MKPTGTVVSGPSTSEAWNTSRIRTGSAVGFKLSSSSLLVRLMRVTRDGAVLRIEQCDHPQVLSGIKSPHDGLQSYLLPLDSKLSFHASTVCCKNFIQCDTSDLEEITLRLKALDHNEQVIEILTRKVLSN